MIFFLMVFSCFPEKRAIQDTNRNLPAFCRDRKPGSPARSPSQMVPMLYNNTIMIICDGDLAGLPKIATRKELRLQTM